LSHEIITNIISRNQNLADIVNELNNALINNLAKMNSADSVNDSLDLIIFKINQAQSTIQISGFKMGFIHYVAATGALNYHKFKGKSLGTPIEEHDVSVLTINFEPGDKFYFYSDGVPDQFGGPLSKKLSSKGLLSLIQTVGSEAPANRERELNLLLRRWQGMNVQTDDMLLIAIDPSSLKFQG
jgi:serine phosphatase RsbU (regulator of sigma subunit)